jgi:uncharacterized protein YgiB involved in biofilm formation
LAADEAGFSRIAYAQYAIFLPCDESRVSNGKKCLKVFQTIQNEEKKNKPKIKKRSNCCG